MGRTSISVTARVQNQPRARKRVVPVLFSSQAYRGVVGGMRGEDTIFQSFIAFVGMTLWVYLYIFRGRSTSAVSRSDPLIGPRRWMGLG